MLLGLKLIHLKVKDWSHILLVFVLTELAFSTPDIWGLVAAQAVNACESTRGSSLLITSESCRFSGSTVAVIPSQ